MSNYLRLGADRQKILDQTRDHVADVWAGFDQARESEPELSAETSALLTTTLPETGIDHAKALDEAATVLDQSIAQSRPRFLAYIGSSGLEIGAVADFLSASYDINVAIDARASSQLEVQTGKWMAEFIGYPGRGLFTSGGTVSNITALAAARQRALPNSREEGNTVATAVYVSSEAHYSNKRAVELLGLGARSVRAIDIDEYHRMVPDALDRAIRADVAAGVTPVCIIASAGTTLTGAIDPLREIATIAATHGVWMHVDGAYGGPAAGTDLVRDRFDGLDLADSVTIDAHKWMFVPKACSIVLVRDYSALARTFGHHEAYMPHETDEPNPVDVTLEYSRPLRALKLWLGFRAHGASEFRRAIEHNIELARMAYARASVDPTIRVLPHPPQLSIVPMQHVPRGMTDPERISAHNAELCRAIERDGRVYLSPAVIDGETWLRPCFTNFRTEESDVDALFEVIADLGGNLVSARMDA